MRKLYENSCVTCVTQLEGGVLLKMQRYFEVMFKGMPNSVDFCKRILFDVIPVRL